MQVADLPPVEPRPEPEFLVEANARLPRVGKREIEPAARRVARRTYVVWSDAHRRDELEIASLDGLLLQEGQARLVLVSGVLRWVVICDEAADDAQPWIAVEQRHDGSRPGGITRYYVVILHDTADLTPAQADRPVQNADFVQVVRSNQEAVWPDQPVHPCLQGPVNRSILTDDDFRDARIAQQPVRQRGHVPPLVEAGDDHPESRIVRVCLAKGTVLLFFRLTRAITSGGTRPSSRLPFAYSSIRCQSVGEIRFARKLARRHICASRD